MCLLKPPHPPSSVMCLRHFCSCQSLLMMQWELRNTPVMTSGCYSGLYMGLQDGTVVALFPANTRCHCHHQKYLCWFITFSPSLSLSVCPSPHLRLSQTQLPSQYYHSHKYWICMRNTTLLVFAFRALLLVILVQNEHLSNMCSGTKALFCNCNNILSLLIICFFR